MISRKIMTKILSENFETHFLEWEKCFRKDLPAFPPRNSFHVYIISAFWKTHTWKLIPKLKLYDHLFKIPNSYFFFLKKHSLPGKLNSIQRKKNKLTRTFFKSQPESRDVKINTKWCKITGKQHRYIKPITKKQIFLTSWHFSSYRSYTYCMYLAFW